VDIVTTTQRFHVVIQKPIEIDTAEKQVIAPMEKMRKDVADYD
jgi:hypothetical protein